MRSHDAMKDDEAVAAAWEAAHGAGYGACKYGVACALLGAVGYAVSPVYRGLTMQFKVYASFTTPLPSLGVASVGRWETPNDSSLGTCRCRGWP